MAAKDGWLVIMRRFYDEVGVEAREKLAFMEHIRVEIAIARSASGSHY